MSYRRDDDYVDPTAVLLVFVLLIVIVVGIIAVITQAVKISRFDGSFENGEIEIKANYIPLGESGSPETSVLPEWMPTNVEAVGENPRLFEVTKCIGLALPEETIGVYASTSFFQNDLVSISIPPQSTGTVNVCVPQGTRIEVVLWARTSSE